MPYFTSALGLSKWFLYLTSATVKSEGNEGFSLSCDNPVWELVNLFLPRLYLLAFCTMLGVPLFLAMVMHQDMCMQSLSTCLAFRLKAVLHD